MLESVSSSTRRIVTRAALVLLAVVAVAGAAPWAVRRFRSFTAPFAGERADRPPTDEEIRAARRAEERLADVQKANWEKATDIAPREAVVDSSGERVRWFQGFGLSVESVPPGATVVVNGQTLGETPLTASVQCTPGEAVRVEVRKQGLAPVTRSTRCREDQLVELSVQLR